MRLATIRTGTGTGAGTGSGTRAAVLTDGGLVPLAFGDGRA